MNTRALLVTVDLAAGLLPVARQLHAVFARLGVRTTWLLDGQVLREQGTVDWLRQLPDCELGPLGESGPLAREYGWEQQGRAVAALTALFAQRTGRRPRSFRAGNAACGRGLGRRLLELGYVVDSSMPSAEGDRSPWFVHRCGDLSRPGRSVLLEVPVAWYWPGNVTIAGDDPAPICVQLPASELLAWGRGEAGRLDELERVLAALLQRGFVPATLCEHHATAMAMRAEGQGPQRAPIRPSCPSARDRRLPVSLASVSSAVGRHGTQPWHVHAAESRLLRWESTESCCWIAEHFQRDAAVLDAGCGVGTNLLWLAAQGFADLSGFDLDARAIDAAKELAAGQQARFWVDDGLDPRHLQERTFDVVTAFNWTCLVEDFDLDVFLRQWSARLRPGGALLIDVIDRSYAEHPRRCSLTWDWERPEAERRPSEYRHLCSADEMQTAAAACGLRVEQAFLRQQEIQRVVYVLRKPARPRVLVVVDEPGWAHDHKAEALCLHLGDEFEMQRCYHKDLKPGLLDSAALVVVFYWLQVNGSPEIVAAFARNRHKLVLGVCSHEEIAGARRELALPHLASAAAVFVHNRALFTEVAALLPEQVPLFATPNGVDTQRFHPAGERTPGPLRVGWAGSLDNFGRELRGYDLIEAACRDLPGVVLTPACKEQRQRTHAEMADWYRGLDVLVCMSRSEGTPNPCLEAAASGVALLTTAVGNMPEFVTDGDNGWLLPREARALRQALIRLRDDRGLCARAGLRARETALGWSWPVQAEAFRHMFRAVLAGHMASKVACPRRWEPDVSVCVAGDSERSLLAQAEVALATCAIMGLRCEVVVANGEADAWQRFEARACGDVVAVLGPGGGPELERGLATLREGAVLVTGKDRQGCVVRREHLRTFVIAPEAGARQLHGQVLARVLAQSGCKVATTS